LDNTDNNTHGKYYSLLELTSSIESVIKKTYKSSYWVKAEIAKLNYYPKSGHCYPDLVEKEKGRVLAQIRATIWAGSFNSLNENFLKITGESLSDGMSVLLRVTVNFHPVYGLGLQVIDIEPAFTLGELLKEKLQSIQKLKALGVFHSNKELKPALLLKRLAVISVETSKGYHDFKNILSTNEWGYGIFHMLFPAMLQGAGAIKSISQQLKRISNIKDHFDAVVIIRGGGGDIGLSSYDNFNLAKTVALFPLPVITGIGHATNETVVEQISFINKITPTDVAYYLIQRFHNFAVRIQESQDKLINRLKVITESEKNRIQSLGIVMKGVVDKQIYYSRLELAKMQHEINSSLTSSLVEHKTMLRSLKVSVSTGLIILTGKQENQIIELKNRLISSTKKANDLNNTIINSLSQQLRLLDPVNVLRRGYSIATHNGKSLADVNQLKQGDVVETKFYKGKISSKVISIEKPEK
jgi:exodeoxyribonuclease VII large subunit